MNTQTIHHRIVELHTATLPHAWEPERPFRRIQPQAAMQGKLFHCDFWPDAQVSKADRKRPVVLLSNNKTAHGPCLVAPTTTEPRDDDPWAVGVSALTGGLRTWVLCNRLFWVAPIRLSPVDRTVPGISDVAFKDIMARVAAWVPPQPVGFGPYTEGAVLNR